MLPRMTELNRELKTVPSSPNYEAHFITLARSTVEGIERARKSSLEVFKGGIKRI